MRHWVARAIAVGMMAVLGFAAAVPPVHAIKQFYAELEARYVKHGGNKKNDVAVIIALEQARCTICHPRDDKHKLTDYGGQVSLRINKYDRKDKKIQTALEEVGALRSEPDDPKSPTYDELFRQGKLPLGRAR